VAGVVLAAGGPLIGSIDQRELRRRRSTA
jgi:hypothetical protein